MAKHNNNDQSAVERKRPGGFGWMWILGAVALAAIALFLLIPLFNDRDAISPGNATIEEITTGRATYQGRSVLLNGQVAEVIGPNAFVMRGTTVDGAASDATIMVIGATQNLAAINDQLLNGRVLAAGTVREFHIAGIEQEIGYDLDDNQFTNWHLKPVLVASAVQAAGAPASVASNATIPEILQSADQYASQNVIIGGQILKMLDTNGVVVAANAVEAGDNLVDTGLLVLRGQESLFSFDAGWLSQRVLAAGVVRTFTDLATLESEIGYDLNDAAYTPYVGKPVLVATAMQQATAGTVGLGEFSNVTIGDIAGDFQPFIGRQVAVQSNVEDVISPYAFSLDEDTLLQGGIDNDLLVLSANQNNDLINGELIGDGVVVAGTVRQFVLADIENQIGFDLDDTLFADWADKPVIVASVIRPVEAQRVIPPAPIVDPIPPAGGTFRAVH